MLNYLERAGACLAHRFGAPVNTVFSAVVAIYTAIWGFWIANPWWEVFNKASIYSWLEGVAGEWFWGSLAIVCGSVMLYGIVRHTYSRLIQGAFIGFIHWSLITYGYFVGDWENTGGITSAMIATSCGFIYLNLKMNKDNLE